jgi:hypothetical protein
VLAVYRELINHTPALRKSTSVAVISPYKAQVRSPAGPSPALLPGELGLAAQQQQACRACTATRHESHGCLSEFPEIPPPCCSHQIPAGGRGYRTPLPLLFVWSFTKENT